MVLGPQRGYATRNRNFDNPPNEDVHRECGDRTSLKLSQGFRMADISGTFFSRGGGGRSFHENVLNLKGSGLFRCMECFMVESSRAGVSIRWSTWQFPKIRGPQYRPQSTVILVIGIHRKVPPILGNLYSSSTTL